jgi:hypothetical protein
VEAKKAKSFDLRKWGKKEAKRARRAKRAKSSFCLFCSSCPFCFPLHKPLAKLLAQVEKFFVSFALLAFFASTFALLNFCLARSIARSQFFDQAMASGF